MKAKTALWTARWAGFLVWAAVAASAAFWALRLLAPGTPVPPHATGVAGTQALRGDLARVLGGPAQDHTPTPVVTAAPSRFQLLGVVSPPSPRAAAEGLALIAVDGKPARAYRVGAVIDGDLVLQRVRTRGADLGARDAPTPAVALQLAPPAPAATGTLPGVGAARLLPPQRPVPGQLPPPTAVLPVPTTDRADPLEPADPAQAPDLDGESDAPEAPSAPARPLRHGSQTM